MKERLRPRALAQRARDVWRNLPPETGAELRAAAWRLRRVRTPRQAVTALDAEVERLFEHIVPTRVAHPLPVRSRRAALAMVTATAGAAAAVDEVEAIALLLPGADVVAAPALPAVLAASFAALSTEAYVALSLRVHLLEAAGAEVDAAAVTHDVVRAMTGHNDTSVASSAAKSISRRLLRRWARGVVPFVGIGYASWDAQKTIRSVATMEIPARRIP